MLGWSGEVARVTLLDSDKVENAITSWLRASPSVPGMIVLVRDADSEVSAHAGFADREHTQPITAAHVFRIASNTKTFVAAATMRLVEHRVIGLDQPIANRVPSEVRRLLAQRYDLNAITIRMLLRHTSGIASHDTGANDGPATPYLAAVKMNPAHRWTAAEQIAFSVERFPPTHAPGTTMRYTDTAYVVLGQVIEHATTQNLSAAVRELCRLDELGMRNTWWESFEPAATPPPRARVQLGDEDWESVDCSIDLYGGGGLVSSVADLTTWWRALFHHQILSPESLAAMQSPLAPSNESHGDAGLGMFRRQLAGRSWWTHSGYWGSIVLHDPDADLTLTAFRNQSTIRTASLEPTYTAILDAVLPQ
jgi:D-alanyl-D-alanine carboxypeptidase